MAKSIVKRSVTKGKQRMAATFALALEQASVEKTVPGALAVMTNWSVREFADNRHRVTDETREKIEHLAQEGYNANQIAIGQGLSAPTVRKVLKARKKK